MLFKSFKSYFFTLNNSSETQSGIVTVAKDCSNFRKVTHLANTGCVQRQTEELKNLVQFLGGFFDEFGRRNYFFSRLVQNEPGF